MNAAIVRKTWRDSWLPVLVVTAALLGFDVLVVRALSELPAESARLWLDRPLFRDMMTVLLGADLVAGLTPTGLVTIGFGHPVVYALVWAMPLTICTRVSVGEIDRGTADLILSLPASRASVYVSVSSVWLLAGVPVCLAPLAAIWIGERLFPFAEPIDFGRLAIVSVNLWVLCSCVGGITSMVSGLVIRRGTAVGISLAVVLASVLLNFLAMLWPAAERVSFLGLLHYYRPLPCVRTGEWPVLNMSVLALIGAAGWLIGWRKFCWRDIPAP